MFRLKNPTTIRNIWPLTRWAYFFNLLEPLDLYNPSGPIPYVTKSQAISYTRWTQTLHPKYKNHNQSLDPNRLDHPMYISTQTLDPNRLGHPRSRKNIVTPVHNKKNLNGTCPKKTITLIVTKKTQTNV